MQHLLAFCHIIALIAASASTALRWNHRNRFTQLNRKQSKREQMRPTHEPFMSSTQTFRAPWSITPASTSYVTLNFPRLPSLKPPVIFQTSYPCCDLAVGIQLISEFVVQRHQVIPNQSTDEVSQRYAICPQVGT